MKPTITRVGMSTHYTGMQHKSKTAGPKIFYTVSGKICNSYLKGRKGNRALKLTNKSTTEGKALGWERCWSSTARLKAAWDRYRVQLLLNQRDSAPYVWVSIWTVFGRGDDQQRPSGFSEPVAFREWQVWVVFPRVELKASMHKSLSCVRVR